MKRRSSVPRKKFSLARHDGPLDELVRTTDKKILAVWAAECAERVLPYFEECYPDDPRPRHALTTLQAWIATGEFSMTVIRKASLGSHAAARDAGDDTPARSAARAAERDWQYRRLLRLREGS